MGVFNAKAGTYAYMAPEIMGKPHEDNPSALPELVPPKLADCYSLGVIFWEILTRCKPFDDCDNPMQLCFDICLHDLELPKVENIPKMVQQVLDRLLNHEPTKRLFPEQVSDLMLNFLHVFKKKEWRQQIYTANQVKEEELEKISGQIIRQKDEWKLKVF